MMDAVDFLKEVKRMCDSHAECDGCPGSGKGCGVFPDTDIELVSAVEQWAQEHPEVHTWTNADQVAEDLRKIGFNVDTDKLSTKCPPRKSSLFGKGDTTNCKSDCEKCLHWWNEEYRGEETVSKTEQVVKGA